MFRRSWTHFSPWERPFFFFFVTSGTIMGHPALMVLSKEPKWSCSNPNVAWLFFNGPLIVFCAFSHILNESQFKMPMSIIYHLLINNWLLFIGSSICSSVNGPNVSNISSYHRTDQKWEKHGGTRQSIKYAYTTNAKTIPKIF